MPSSSTSQDSRLYALLGQRIRFIRESQAPRMSQDELAQILGLKRTSITNIERGNQKLGIDAIYKLCERFGLELQDLLPTVAQLRQTGDRSIVVGGRSQEVGRKTADVVARLRPDSLKTE